ncbi:MAG TPA: TAXI family TRAP transporter solute-binding subunit [Candidatus Acidoferrum sp.]|nr:TAXI family TRAP transporter solute-binding subunit [Candidatus Acidoferrum sp.]
MLRRHRFFLVALGLLAFAGRVAAQAQANAQEAQKVQAAAKAKEAEIAQVEAEKKAWAEYCSDTLEAVPAGDKPIFLTGSRSGYYSKVGNAIAGVLTEKKAQPGQPSIQLDPIGTTQTRCNLLGLETHHASFALVQSDVAHDAWFGHPPVRSAPVKGITLVAPLYVEAVHIVVRPHLNLAKLADLKGRRVWLGTRNSLTVFTAKRILDAAGLTPDQVAALEECPSTKGACPEKPIAQMNSDDALQALQDLKLDAMFQVGVVPYDTLRDKIVPSDGEGHLLDAERQRNPCDAVRHARSADPTLRDSELHLFNLDLDLVKRLVDDGSYIEALIPADAYCQGDATLTVGVRALLLTNREPSDPAVSQIAKAILGNQAEIETKLREGVEQQQMEHGDAITGVPSKLTLLRVLTPGPLYARYHETIKTEKIYFDPWKVFVKRQLPRLAILLLIMFLVFYRWRGPIGRALAYHGNWPLGILIFLGVWVGISAWMKYYEGAVNEDYSSLPTAMYSMILNLLGFGKDPITQNGQYLWHWGSWATRLIYFGLLVPGFRLMVPSGWWPKFKKRLGSLDSKRRTSAEPTASPPSSPPVTPATTA